MENQIIEGAEDSFEEAVSEPDFFGDLFPLVDDDDITDIDISSGRVFVTSCSGERKLSDVTIGEEFLNRLSLRIANTVSKPFNREFPVLEAQTDRLRITAVHPSVSLTGTSLCIRKSLPRLRMTEESVLRDGYCTLDELQLLKDCVKAHMNIVVCGEPAAGKTECAKFLSSFIPAEERVITIEDVPEWHYAQLFPERDAVELAVGRSMGYRKAIKTSLRLNPKWLMLSEARSTEVVRLLESLSAGVSAGITTIHVSSVEKIPDRMVNMAGAIESADRFVNNIYSFIDVGILVGRGLSGEAGGVHAGRHIEQIGFFSREDGKNIYAEAFSEGVRTDRSLPPEIVKKFERAGLMSYGKAAEADEFSFASDKILLSAPTEDDADKLLLSTSVNDASDEEDMKARMEEISRELLALGRKGGTCLGKTYAVGRA